MAIWSPILDGRSGPTYLRIVEALAEDVASGALPAGARLPPHRDLAYRLALSPNTTHRAYAEAAARALIRGEVGRGTFVRGPVAPAPGEGPEDMRRPDAGPIDLSRNLPAPGLAVPDLAEAMAALAREADLAALSDYQTEADIARHARAGAAWLARSGVSASEGEVVATSGAQHAIFCALAALARPGDLLLTEALTYAPVKAMAARLGLTVRAVAGDAEGIDPDALEAVCRSHAPTALYLTPTLHTPTTRTLGPARRMRIAEIAERCGLTVIEDDVFGLLKPDPPAPIAVSAPDRTVYLTSVSKCLAPGLRVGFLRAPAHLATAIRSAVNLTCWMTPPLTTEIAAHWIEAGAADRLIAAQRKAAARRQALAAEILGGWEFLADPHGLHLWLEPPEGWSAESFRREAERRGVRVVEAAAFAVDPSHRPRAARLSLGHEASDDRLRIGLERLRAILDAGPQGAAPVL